MPSVYSAYITPSDRVSNFISIREYPSSSDSDVVGKLKPGEKAELLKVVPRWYKVRFNNSVEGYVSKAWSRVIPGQLGFIPYSIHFLDVGVGDATVIDVGEKEIIIDGGNYKNDLHNYLRDADIVDGPVELGVVTHADADHWKGFVRAFNLDGKADNPHLFIMGSPETRIPVNPYSSAFAGLPAGLFSDKAYEVLSTLVDNLAKQISQANGSGNGG